jgi:hypothetical protein
MCRLSLVLITTIILNASLNAQRITALHGSQYSGTISNEYNPASMLNDPDRWDLMVFSLGFRSLTNKLYFDNTGLLSPRRSTLRIKEGSFKRSLNAATTAQLLHFRYKLDEDNTVSIGFNLRNYFHANSGPAYFSDKTRTVRDFIKNNDAKSTYYGNLQTDLWAEMILGYGRVLHQDAGGRLQAGINLKVMRALGAAWGTAEKINISDTGTGSNYALIGVEGKYAHSYTLDALFAQGGRHIGRMWHKARSAIGFNIGAEYVSFDGAGDNEYNWKLGASLMDIGRTSHLHSNYSFQSSGVKTPIDADRFDRFIKSVSGYQELQDTLKQSWVNTYDTLKGDFTMNNPTRVVVNYDKSIMPNVFVNAEVQWNFRSTADKKEHNTNELSFVTLTPRWETRKFGAYMPISYSTNNLWVGAAVKAGPLIMGVDNVGWIVGKKSVPNGGFYVALQFRGGETPEKGRALKCWKF